MKKIMFGFVLGAGLMFAVQAGAASLVGSKVTSTNKVMLNGKSLGTAPIINGTSYLPVRTISNALDVQVTSVSGGTINLADQEMLELEQKAKALDAEFNNLNEQRFKVKREIDRLTTSISSLKSLIAEQEKLRDDPSTHPSVKASAEMKLGNLQSELETSEAEIAPLKPVYEDLTTKLNVFVEAHPDYAQGVNN